MRRTAARRAAPRASTASTDRRPHDVSPDVAKAVQAISANFSRVLPRGVTGGQPHEPEEPIASAKGVPDGDYRVIGHDWIFTIKGGECVAASKAPPTADPADYIEVPAPEPAPAAPTIRPPLQV